MKLALDCVHQLAVVPMLNHWVLLLERQSDGYCLLGCDVVHSGRYYLLRLYRTRVTILP